MMKRMIVCGVLFLGIVGFVTSSTLFLKAVSSDMSSVVDGAVDLVETDMKRAGEAYGTFLETYEKNKFFLSLIVYKEALEEIDTLSLRIAEAFDDENPYENLMADMERLRALICGLYERYGCFPENIF